MKRSERTPPFVEAGGVRLAFFSFLKNNYFLYERERERERLRIMTRVQKTEDINKNLFLNERKRRKGHLLYGLHFCIPSTLRCPKETPPWPVSSLWLSHLSPSSFPALAAAALSSLQEPEKELIWKNFLYLGQWRAVVWHRNGLLISHMRQKGKNKVDVNHLDQELQTKGQWIVGALVQCQGLGEGHGHSSPITLDYLLLFVIK